jgi:hypothetical protein
MLCGLLCGLMCGLSGDRPRADHGQTTGRPRADHGQTTGHTAGQATEPTTEPTMGQVTGQIKGPVGVASSHGLSPDRPFQRHFPMACPQTGHFNATFPWPVPRQAISSCICHENLASLPHPARIASTLHGAHNGCEGTDGALICAFASGIIYSINMAFVIRMTIIVNQ